MGKDKDIDFSVFLKSGYVLYCFSPVLFVTI